MSDTPHKSGEGALARADVAPRLPARDLERARAFYADRLGLQPVEEREGGLRYRCSSTVFSLFASAGDPSGQHTQMAWEVDDIEAAVAELRARGVVFEDYDLPGLKTVDGIAQIAGTYPSDGGIGQDVAVILAPDQAFARRATLAELQASATRLPACAGTTRAPRRPSSGADRPWGYLRRHR